MKDLFGVFEIQAILGEVAAILCATPFKYKPLT